MRVRLQDGREGRLSTLFFPVKVLVGSEALTPAEAGPLELASPAVRGAVAAIDKARRDGFTFKGLRAPAAYLGVRGGRSSSPAQTAARRENGRKGGRPRKAKAP